MLNVVHQNSAGPGVFAEVTAERGDTVDVWEPPQEGPPSVAAHDAVFVFGGSMNVDQDAEHAWLATERTWLEELIDRRVPVLGLCLGSQLLAQAAGASPGRADQGEVGWHEVELCEEAHGDPLLGVLPERFPAFEWHEYESPLPPGAVPLARSSSMSSGLSPRWPRLGPAVPRRGGALLDRPLARRGRPGRGRPAARGTGDGSTAGGLERARAGHLPPLPGRGRGPHARVECPAVDLRLEKVTLETDRYRIEGSVTLPAEGHRSRLSDHVNRRGQEFFTVQEARIRSLDGTGEEWSEPVIMIGRAHIRLIVPAAG